jgi:choline dehydrogenase-like flavoprotein
VAVYANPDTARPTDEIVDVLIIGAGASGAAVAWSLAETRMKILCLEQGDWIKPTEFPTNGRDWEARRYADFDISPNRRARDTDYPINDDNSLMKIANFNGVGGGTILFTAHYPRLHPSDFRVKTLDGIADDWPIDYWTLEPYFAENDRMTGVAGLAGDPAYPPHQPTLPPVPLGKTGTRYARAMNRLGWHWWPLWPQRNMTGAPSASTSATALLAVRKAPRRASTSPIGRMRCAPESSCVRAAECGRSPPTNTAWRPGSSITTRKGWSGSSRRRS